MNETDREWTRWSNQDRRLQTTDEERRSTWTKRQQEQIASWRDFMTGGAHQGGLVVRADITMKQRRQSNLVTRRPSQPILVHRRCADGEVVVVQTGELAALPRYEVHRPDDDGGISVNTRGKGVSLQRSINTSPYYYLGMDELRNIAVRIANQLNRRLLGQRSRRAINPERLSALICKHDDGRSHLHCVFVLPVDSTMNQFEAALTKALTKEPFAYHVRNIEEARTAAGSIYYNLNDKKTRDGNALLYIHTNVDSTTDSGYQES